MPPSRTKAPSSSKAATPKQDSQVRTPATPAPSAGAGLDGSAAGDIGTAYGNAFLGGLIAREASGASAPADPQGSFDAATSGGGGAVPYQSKMEAAFGTDFSGVEAHTGQSDALSGIGANAAAQGETVAFGSSSPSTETVAHELTHVVQNRQSGGGGVQAEGLTDVGSPAEREAENVGRRVAGGGQAGPINAAPGDIARDAAALAEFRKQLNAGKRAESKTAWAALDAADKATVKGTADDLVKMLRVLHTDALAMMKEVGATFASDQRLGAFVLSSRAGNAATWMTQLKAQSLWADFIAAAPKAPTLNDKQAAQLKGMMDAAGTAAEGRQVFQKAYPAVTDATYMANFLQTTPWTVAHMQRLYAALQSYLPIAHVQTLNGGFFLGTQFRQKTTVPFAALGFAFFHPTGGGNRCVLPLSSAGANGGGTGHDMTGGTQSGARWAQKDSKKHMTHFTGSVLHEVGHGVGAAGGGAGNNWAAGNNPGTPRFSKNMGIGTWSKALFRDKGVNRRAKRADDAAKKAGNPAPIRAPQGAGKTSAEVAREWMAAEIKKRGTGSLGSVAGYTSGEMQNWISAYAASEKLTRYYNSAPNPGNAYKFNGSDCVKGGWVYVYMSRGGMNHTKYKATAWRKKVSWYSLSSEKEWFAEQYAHYYRIEPKGKGLPGPVKRKMRQMEKMTWDTGTNDLKAPSPGGGGGGGGGGEGGGVQSAGADAAGEQQQQPPQEGTGQDGTGGEELTGIQMAPFSW